MTDINSPAADTAIAGHAPAAAPRPKSRQQHAAAEADLVVPNLVAPNLVAPNLVAPNLVAMVELLFFAYRDFTAEPDAILSQLGFGRAHHRVLHFVNRHPGLRVADLLEVLKITKQSLARVLKQLVGEGFVEQATGASDRRERRLHLTGKGRALAERLLDLQTRRIAAALTAAGDDAERIAQSFLFAVIADGDRAEVDRLVGGRCGGNGLSGGRLAGGARGAQPQTHGESP